jgi:hypothetical protein
MLYAVLDNPKLSTALTGGARLARQEENKEEGEQQGDDHYEQPRDFPGRPPVARIQRAPLRSGNNPPPAAIQAPVSFPAEALYETLEGVPRPAPLYMLRITRRTYQFHGSFLLFRFRVGPPPFRSMFNVRCSTLKPPLLRTLNFEL